MLEDRTSFSLRPHSLQIGLDVARNSISAHKDQRQTNGGGGATTIGKTIRQIKFLSSCKREREREREREGGIFPSHQRLGRFTLRLGRLLQRLGRLLQRLGCFLRFPKHFLTYIGR